MKDFFTALQFLTQIKLSEQKNWTQESFARSVPWFPLVGMVIGLILAGLNIMMLPYFTDYLRAALLLAAEVAVTGGLLCDGLLDTADGIFSGRERRRMLEIMKDSAAGANGVVFFFVLFILKAALYLSIPGWALTPALFSMPVVTRLVIVGGITLFPYARPDGIGKFFTLHSKKSYLFIALLLTIGLLLPLFSPPVYIACVVTVFSCWLLACRLCNILGGLTGDTYGFLAETGNVIFLFTTYIYLVI